MADWQSSIKIHSLARDLGLKATPEPVEAIKKLCHRRVQGFLRDFPSVSTLDELLELACNKLETKFEVVRSDSDLKSLMEKYISVGEKGFALLENELDPSVFGITFKRTKPKSWEPAYVSVIDGRGAKAFRRYFTKWHELGHLLVLTDQFRLEFRRTHVHPDHRDPEERLVDVLASEFGFLSGIVKPRATGLISFDKLESLRSSLCPEASHTASLIGLTRVWPEPCLLVRAEMALRKSEQRASAQSAFSFFDDPQGALRAVKATPNDAAREAGIVIFQNMRIPDSSVIMDIYRAGDGRANRTENLKSWGTTDGARLESRRVHVEARFSNGGVDALISPA